MKRTRSSQQVKTAVQRVNSRLNIKRQRVAGGQGVLRRNTLTTISDIPDLSSLPKPDSQNDVEGDECKVISLENGQKFLIRPMRLEDVTECYQLGQGLFTSQLATTLYRTWDEYNLVEAFYTTPEFCLVAVNIDEAKFMGKGSRKKEKHHSQKAKIVGFVLGSIIVHSRSKPPTGYVEWVGVRSSYQRVGIGTALVKEVVSRMCVEEEGQIAQVLADTPLVNAPALAFFKRLRFGMPEAHIYMHMNLSHAAETRTRKSSVSSDHSPPPSVSASSVQGRRSARNHASSPALGGPRISLVPTRSRLVKEGPGRPSLLPNPAGIKMREMKLDDLYPIYKLGTEVFAAHSTLQRTWTEDEVTSFFLTDGDYCMVAETKDGEIAGFVLGTVMERPRWHYGYLVWMGVNPRIQRAGVGRIMFEAFKQEVTEAGANMMLVDTQQSNTPAVGFFQKLGFKEDEDSAHCYLTMNVPKE